MAGHSSEIRSKLFVGRYSNYLNSPKKATHEGQDHRVKKVFSNFLAARQPGEAGDLTSAHQVE
jgi:hypothetical protein